MATAAELLAENGAVDKTLIISNDLRTITIPSSVPCLGVEYDDEVLELDFKMPRYLGKTDLSEFTIRINYINANGESDAYTVRNPVIGDEYIKFYWRVGPIATRHKGNTKFNVCLKKLASDGYIDREFNTTLATIPVLEGLEVEEEIVTRYSDILEQWRQELFGIGVSEAANMRLVSQMEQENIAQKGAKVLVSIPEDYVETYNLSHEATRTKADAIVSSIISEEINISDSSDDHVRGLTVFGKTTNSLHSIGDNGAVEVVICGKNLLPIDTTSITMNGVTFIPNSDGSVTCSGTATDDALYDLLTVYELPTYLHAGERYFASGATDAVTIQVYDWQENWVHCLTTSSEGVFTIDQNATGLLFRVAVEAGMTVNNVTIYPMIRSVTVSDSTFESYISTQTINVRHSLLGIPVSSGGNYTDHSGQQWICDEVNYENHKLIRRVGDVTIDGTQVYKINSHQFDSLGKYLFEYRPDNIFQAQIDQPALSDKLILDKWANFTGDEDTATLYVIDGRLIIFLPDQTIQTTEDFADYVTNNPIRILYVRDTPLEILLDREDVTTFETLRSNRHHTTVTNSAGATMELKYNADTEIWLMNRISALIGDIPAILDAVNGEVV